MLRDLLRLITLGVHLVAVVVIYLVLNEFVVKSTGLAWLWPVPIIGELVYLLLVWLVSRRRKST